MTIDEICRDIREAFEEGYIVGSALSPPYDWDKVLEEYEKSYAKATVDELEKLK